ncbi:hypothetical protein F5Y18DRAFT_442878 [Xylariaceae sp. FL1019]|nr:hypothetical protein F5Y18DRAFT_442878 [Xylariaceae sp. FL1019]
MAHRTSSKPVGGFQKLEIGGPGYGMTYRRSELRRYVREALNYPVPASEFTGPAAGTVDFRADGHVDSILWIRHLMEPLKKVARLACYPDASGNGGLGLAMQRLDGEDINPLWNTPRLIRRCFAAKGRLGSTQLETMGVYMALREAYKQVRNLAKGKSLQANVSPWIIVAVDSVSAIQYYQERYHGQRPSVSMPAHYDSHMMEPLESLLEAGCRVSFVWIPGHVGIEGNTNADKLATLGWNFGQQIPNGIGHASGHSIFSLTDLIRDKTLNHIDALHHDFDMSLEYGGTVSPAGDILFYQTYMLVQKNTSMEVLEQLRDQINIAIAKGQSPARSDNQGPPKEDATKGKGSPTTEKNDDYDLQAIGASDWFRPAHVAQNPSSHVAHTAMSQPLPPASGVARQSAPTRVSGRNASKAANLRIHKGISDRNANKRARQYHKRKVRALNQTELRRKTQENSIELEEELTGLEEEQEVFNQYEAGEEDIGRDEEDLDQLKEKLERLQDELAKRNQETELAKRNQEAEQASINFQLAFNY